MPLGIPYLDGLRQFGAERLAAVTARHPHVAAFLAHAHPVDRHHLRGPPLVAGPGVVSTAGILWEARRHRTRMCTGGCRRRWRPRPGL
ncbi:hypothetical protein [Kitasatospora albolonga]|uniref:hypothetical protein n=1 Tax=Kitasatospora albolonga TaxID=68173 RepID=UPI0031E7EF4F